MCKKLLQNLFDELSNTPQCDGCECFCYLGAEKEGNLYHPTINSKKINTTDANGRPILNGPYTTYESAIQGARASTWLCAKYRKTR